MAVTESVFDLACRSSVNAVAGARPECSADAWFAMVLADGIGIGLILFGRRSRWRVSCNRPSASTGRTQRWRALPLTHEATLDSVADTVCSPDPCGSVSRAPCASPCLTLGIASCCCTALVPVGNLAKPDRRWTASRPSACRCRRLPLRLARRVGRLAKDSVNVCVPECTLAAIDWVAVRTTVTSTNRACYGVRGTDPSDPGAQSERSRTPSPRGGDRKGVRRDQRDRPC